MLPVSALLGYVLGYLLDKEFQTTWMYIAGVILGIVAGFVQLIRQLMRDTRDDELGRGGNSRPVVDGSRRGAHLDTGLGHRRRRRRRAGGLARLVVGRRMADWHRRVGTQLPLAETTRGRDRRAGSQAAQSRVPGHALPAVGRGRLCYIEIFCNQPAGRTFGSVCLGCGGYYRNPLRTGICSKLNCGSLSCSTIILPVWATH